MKSFLMCMCLILAAYSAWVTVTCWPGVPVFTDLMGQKSAPDDLIVASYVVQDYGLGSGTTFGLTLSGKSENPLKSEPILVQAEDDGAIDYKWLSNDEIEVRLPCGWWGRLTNHYQLRGTNHIIDVTYLPPPENCPEKTSGSNSIPN